jgi:hypothetical protein
MVTKTFIDSYFIALKEFNEKVDEMTSAIQHVINIILEACEVTTDYYWIFPNASDKTKGYPESWFKSGQIPINALYHEQALETLDWDFNESIPASFLTLPDNEIFKIVKEKYLKKL